MKKGRAFIVLSFFLSVPFSSAVGNSITDYSKAQKCYHSLDKTSLKGWKSCLRQFEAVLEKYPGTLHAKKALFSMARLFQERSEVSKALSLYNQFLRDYPKDALADDSLFQIARLRNEQQKETAKARRALEAILERYPSGDMAAGASKYLKNLGLERVAEERTDSTFLLKTVVIDPGHGGNDLGARGVAGTKEAEVSLQIAQKLAFHLKKKLGLNVLLTRTNNKTVSLEERTRLANNKKADLFISIHANAHASQKVKGVQTFYLNNATSSAAQELANRENKVAGKTLSLSERILTTLLQNANTLESRDLAHLIQENLVLKLSQNYSGVEDLKVDTAIFQVLDGVSCPSILIETSFITNPLEEKRLKDAKYQWTLAEGIAGGVEKYRRARQQLAGSSSL